jgi:hypothetical protein
MTSASGSDRFGGVDTVGDLAGGALGTADLAGGGPRRRWHTTLGWSATSAPVGFLLVTGIALGPHGINLLSPSTRPLLDPAVPVALAALGALVGLSIGGRRAADGPWLTAASLGSGVTAVCVAFCVGALAWTSVATDVPSFWILTLASGISAASSLTLPTGNPLEPRLPAIRMAEAGVVLPILAGGLLLVGLRSGTPLGTVILAAQALAITVALATAGWLLLTRASSETEERVFAISALLLVGGLADALSLSALLGGFIAGAFWRYAAGHPRVALSRDVLFVQHSLVVLVLLVAGARVEFSLPALAYGAVYVLARTGGLLVGALGVRRLIARQVPRDLGRHLLQPGVFGIAFALNASIVTAPNGSMLLAAVVVGTIGSEIAALLLPSQGSRE